MWIFTNIGFFSVVEKDGKGTLTVRARIKEDIEALRDKYFPAAKIVATKSSDYPFRIIVDKGSVAEAMKDLTKNIDYTNFKDEVMRKQGIDREEAYMNVWVTMRAFSAGTRRPSRSDWIFDE